MITLRRPMLLPSLSATFPLVCIMIPTPNIWLKTWHNRCRRKHCWPQHSKWSLNRWHQDWVPPKYKAGSRHHSFQDVSSTTEAQEAQIKYKKTMEAVWNTLRIWICRSRSQGRSHKEPGQCIDSSDAAMYPRGGLFCDPWSWPSVHDLECWCCYPCCG